MPSKTVQMAMSLAPCTVCYDNLATDEQIAKAKLFGIGSKFGVCCKCQRQVGSIDPNYQRRWNRWYKKHQQVDKQ
jgi:hypothetical protein